MDARLIAVVERLSEDLANLEKAMAGTQELLKELLKENRKNGKAINRRLESVQASQRFLANQQPRWGGTAPWRAWKENDDHD